MATFKIIKRASGWWHIFNNDSKEVNISDFEAVLDNVAQTFIIQNLNGANVPQIPVGILDIIVIDETDASVEETFTSVEDLKVRLTALGYTPYLGAGNADSITGLISEGTNVTITGSGTLADPYVINASGAGSTQNLQEVLTEGNTTDLPIIFNNGVGEIGAQGLFGADIIGYFMDDAGTVYLKVSLDGAGDTAVITFRDYLQIVRGANQINYGIDKITINGTDYLLPIGASSQIATLADITGGATNLGYTPSPTNGIVTSDTGTDATLPLADTTDAGLLSPSDKTKLNNTSGTNTGDNATNTNSNAYADAKVADAIADGVTTIAPSQNAVFDALAVKVKRIVKDTVASSAVTGTTETLCKTYAISANDFASDDFMKILVASANSTVNSTYTIRVKVNSTNNFATATTIATYSTTSAASYNSILIRHRTFFRSGNLIGFSGTTSAVTDITQDGNTVLNTALSPASPFWIYVSLQNAGGSSSTAIEAVNITN